MTLLRPLMLAVLLVFGQWSAAAHAGEHHALAEAHDCALCAHAQGHDGAPPCAAVSFAPSATPADVFITPATAPVVSARHVYRGRAPPANLVD